MKKILIALGIASAAVAANASYLYWQVTESAVDSKATSWYEDGYDYVTVWVVNDATKEKTALTDVNGYSMITTLDGETDLVYADVSNYSSGGYSFYVELASSSKIEETGGHTVATSSTQTYAELSTSGSIRASYSSISDAPSTSVWHGGSTWTGAPEPTSAVLLLLGLAGLSLKRKQRKLA